MSGMTTGDDIKAMRKFLRESQEEFAVRFDVDQSTIARWETRGTPPRGPARIAIDHVMARIRDAYRVLNQR